MAVQIGAGAVFSQELQLPTGQGVPDVWREIFGYLTDSADFHNLLVASPEYFEPLLEDRKAFLLFPLALKVLDRWDYVAKSTSLECRLVSKFTKSSIDKWILDGNPCLENLVGFDHDIWDPKHDKLHCWRTGVLSLYDHYADKLKSDCSSFLGGSVILNLSLARDSRRLYNFRDLVVRFGNQIRHFRLIVIGPIARIWEILRECLEQMPNLRAFIISDYWTYNGQEEADQRFLPSTLPDLRDLSTLVLDGSLSLHLVLLEKYGSQLKKLCLNRVPIARFHQLPLSFVGNLQHVSLPLMRHVDEVQEYLNATRDSLPTLETISINIHGPILTEVLVALENCFGRSRKLQNLNIHLRDFRSGRDNYSASPSPFVLPSLKRLWIHCNGCCFLSIDFIQGLRETLEEFTLETRLHESSHFTRLVDRMHNSNVWDEMPRLERITIRRGTRLYRAAVEVYSYSRPTIL